MLISRLRIASSFVANKLILTNKSNIKTVDDGNIVNKANIDCKANSGSSNSEMEFFTLGAKLAFAK